MEGATGILGGAEVREVGKVGAIAPFEWARKQRIVIAMSGEVVYTPDGEAVAVAEMMRRYPVIEGGKEFV